MTDRPILDHINQLANEEQRLWERASAGGGLSTSDQERLDTIEVSSTSATTCCISARPAECRPGPGCG